LEPVKAYYDRRAPEYDEWYYGAGRFVDDERPGWAGELAALEHALRELPSARTLDVACGTAYLTRCLQGRVVCLDQSPGMLAIARSRLPDATFVESDALERLPFPDGAFNRVFTGHFYGHLGPDDREHFRAEARRVARELVVVDSALRDDVQPESYQQRTLNDGSRWEVYKRYFRAAELLAELGGGSVLLDGRWFVAVRAG
jgi:ubiquinone/menaquinone biosynthesis C-methylase UbiE